ncbi:dedicator of cytokinesis protein 9 isoform X5 [Folsomia candida]|uniref:dedicator of cytokinesis protein 9 isoform X5 n=1 Tax=Folsomia candida TaxID=158441 RepID=UPI0016051E54|nr:dedicator of cytokinesis protein 9 isoform X5 [Folsomia candida]
MSERKFARVKGKVGSAAQVREEVSKHVRSKTIYQNKSLLVDCTTDTEYSPKKYFSLKRVANDSAAFERDSSSEAIEDLEDNCNLFVRECLKTYSTPYLELSDQLDDEFNYNEKPKKPESLFPNGVGNGPSTIISKTVPQIRRVNSSGSPITNGSSTNGDANSAKAPPWFWNVWSQSRGIQLDEAGIALEGRVGVIYKQENLGERLLQLKWEDGEEKFSLIVWTLEAGLNLVCKLDLANADPVWHGENKLTINEHLTVQSEQKRGFLRDLYTVCVELGCYEKSASLASRENVERARNVLQLFQRATSCGAIKNGRSWTKVRIKVDTSDDFSLKSRSKHAPRIRDDQVPTYFTLRLETLEFRLKTETGMPVEPYFLSISLYDVKNGKKISEDLRSTVDINGHVEEKKNSLQALFKVSDPNEQIFVIVRVEKTLQAVDNDAYFRGNPDAKTGTRISKQLTSSPLFTDEQKYRMALCWSSRCLFKKSGSIASEGTGYILDAESSFTPFYKYEKYTEEELLKTLADIKKPEKVAKLTIVPGVVKIHVEPTGPHELAVKADEKSSPLSIIEFPINSSDNFSRFVHLLYVYPISLSLSAVTGKIRARNIMCRVFLRAEDDIEASPLDQSPVKGCISTFVLHHRTNPEWYSEVKIALPVALDPRLHLLFQFYHISCSFDKATKSKQVENVIGYAWAPLLNKYRFIGGDHTLPVAASLPSGYLQIQPLGLGKGSPYDDEVPTERSSGIGALPQLLNIVRNRNKRQTISQYSGPEIVWLDSKCSMTVRLNLISTVWTKCGSLGAFFTHAEKFFQKPQSSSKFHCDDETTVKMLKALESMDLCTLRDFFPTILNQICNIASTSKVVGTACLKFFISAFHTLIEAGFDNVIEQYVRFRFLSGCQENVGSNKIKHQILNDTLIDAWIDLFETGDGATIASSLEHSRNLFSMIVKSIAVQGIKSPANPEESKLVKLVQLFTSEIVHRCQSGDQTLSRGANENEIAFISALLSVVSQRHVVFAAINAYLACFGPGDSHKVQDFKFNMLQSLVEHPLFLELNSAEGDEEYTRLEHCLWCKRHFLAATVMKQCRSGLGEVTNVRCQALKVIMIGLARHESCDSTHPMWIPWLRVVCDNLHRITKVVNHSSRCSSVSTVLSATTSTLVHQALIKSISGQNHEGHNHGASCSQHSREGSQISNTINLSTITPRHPLLGTESSRSSSLSLNVPNGVSPSISQNSSMVNINAIGNGESISAGDRLSVDRMSFGSVNNCDYLDAISAIKTSNPAASTIVPSTTGGSDTDTIVNEGGSNGSGETQSEGDPDSQSMKRVANATIGDADKSNIVQRRYDRLADDETRPLLVGGLYILKKMGNDRLRIFWNRSSTQERASLLQMVLLACVQFTNARKNSTITKTKIVGISVPPPTMPPSPRSAVPNKKWSSLPSKTTEESAVDGNPVEMTSPSRKTSNTSPFDSFNEWKTLNTETTFVCIDTLSNLCSACKGEDNEMREVIRTSLNVAKAAEDTRAMLSTLQNLAQVEELAAIVFAKGNEDLTHQLFCELLTGFGTSYLIHICVLILGKLFMNDPNRTTSQSLFAISSLSLDQVFVHNFRKALNLLERNMSVNDRSSFMLSITEKLSFIDVSEADGTTYSKANTLVLSGSQPVSNGIIKNKLMRTVSTTALDLSNRLSTVMNSLWVLKACTNEYRIPEVYLKLANSYAYYAKGRLRIETFDSLKSEHLNKKKYSEALMCELHVAARLARQTTTSAEIKRVMLGISRNLRDEFEEEADDNQEEADYTEELIDRMEQCVHLCEKSERYEVMLEVYRMLVDIQESTSDHAALEHYYTQMARACGLIQKKRERFHGTYYRVAFYRPKKQCTSRPMEVFIYKEPNVTSLMEICGKVETAENVIIISGEVDQLPDDDHIYATITHVSPLPSSSPRRKLWSEDFRRHQNISKFTYDTPFAVKSHDKISIDNKAAVHQQWKRRTTVTTEYTFPAVVSRLRVVESTEEDLSPIIVAIDDMQRRVLELRSEFNSGCIKRIQLRLQGSISVQVNQGPLAYVRAFLEKENEYPASDIHKLKAIYRDFVECCRELLIKNAAMILPEQVDYQTQLETDYVRLCQVLNPYIGLGHLELGVNRMSRASVSSY